MRSTCIGCLLVFALIPVPGFGQTKGDATAGKQKYEWAGCAGCHGATGQGDGPEAAGLDPWPPDFTNSKYMITRSDKYLFGIIKKGGAGVKRSPVMPSWDHWLKDEEIWNLVAYIRSLAERRKSLPDK
jgi:mono/diheme cytochrome c family protein